MDARIEIYAVTLGAVPSPRQQDLAYRKILRDDPCAYCGARSPSRDADHIHSRSMDGEDNWRNLTASCRRCNQAKGSRSLLSFLSGLRVGEDRWSRDAERLARWRTRYEAAGDDERWLMDQMAGREAA